MKCKWQLRGVANVIQSFAVHEFSECMENVPTGGLSHFHALMSVVELVSTYIVRVKLSHDNHYIANLF